MVKFKLDWILVERVVEMDDDDGNGNDDKGIEYSLVQPLFFVDSPPLFLFSFSYPLLMK